MAACEASERKLMSINIAETLQLTDQQLDAIVQFRSDFLDRCVWQLALRICVRSSLGLRH